VADYRQSRSENNPQVIACAAPWAGIAVIVPI
jgi:hypothetical protein